MRRVLNWHEDKISKEGYIGDYNPEKWRTGERGPIQWKFEDCTISAPQRKQATREGKKQTPIHCRQSVLYVVISRKSGQCLNFPGGGYLCDFFELHNLSPTLSAAFGAKT